MKKLYVILTLLLMLIPNIVNAAGSIVPSTTNLIVKKGETAVFVITATNATGKINISSADTSVASVNKETEWIENSAIIVTVTGNEYGTTTISVDLTDAATFDSELLESTYNINVTVNKDGDPSALTEDTTTESDFGETELENPATGSNLNICILLILLVIAITVYPRKNLIKNRTQ